MECFALSLPYPTLYRMALFGQPLNDLFVHVPFAHSNLEKACNFFF